MNLTHYQTATIKDEYGQYDSIVFGRVFLENPANGKKERAIQKAINKSRLFGNTEKLYSDALHAEERVVALDRNYEKLVLIPFINLERKLKPTCFFYGSLRGELLMDSNYIYKNKRGIFKYSFFTTIGLREKDKEALILNGYTRNQEIVKECIENQNRIPNRIYHFLTKKSKDAFLWQMNYFRNAEVLDINQKDDVVIIYISMPFFDLELQIKGEAYRKIDRSLLYDPFYLFTKDDSECDFLSEKLDYTISEKLDYTNRGEPECDVCFKVIFI